jgi:hypothetical protein
MRIEAVTVKIVKLAIAEGREDRHHAHPPQALSAMRVLLVEGLPAEPLAAAADFHARILPQIAAPQGDLALVFPVADHTHRGWRLAAVQALARAHAPCRVNALAGGGRKRSRRRLPIWPPRRGLPGRCCRWRRRNARLSG